MSERLHIMIIDDELPARNRLRDLLGDCSTACALDIVGEAGNGTAALEWLNQHHADICLVDIKMPGMSGIELAQHMQKLPHPPAVIFTTAYDQFALQAFEVNAIDYLLKPIRQERLLASLEKARKFAAAPPNLRNIDQKARQYLSVSERGRVLLVPVKDIIFLKAELKYVTVRTADREYLLEESLTHLENEFPERFARIHRNCLVAREAITGFEKRLQDDGDSHWVVLLDNCPEQLPISRRQQAIVREFKQL